jgi:ribosomal protein S6--L-glutamate ligase
MSQTSNLVVVGGERYWHDYLPDWHVIYCRLQVSRWILKDRRLFIHTENGLLEAHAVLWRVGVIRPTSWQRGVLDLIRISGIPCVNSAKSLQRGFDKLSMFAEMAEAGLPVINAEIAVGIQSLELLQSQSPCVLKVGNHHGGLGKARALDASQWSEISDLAAIIDDYSIVEPFIDYVADVRCLIVKDDVWCLRRDNEDWKVNRGTTTPVLIEPPNNLETWTRKAAQHLEADVLGLDFIQAQDGTWHLLECNDIPGLEGFPEVARQTIASIFRTF